MCGRSACPVITPGACAAQRRRRTGEESRAASQRRGTRLQDVPARQTTLRFDPLSMSVSSRPDYVEARIIMSQPWKATPLDDSDNYTALKLKLSGYVKPGQELFRNVLFDQLYASMPAGDEVKVQIYNAEIAPGGFTNWHCHNGATFFIALEGVFEATVRGRPPRQGDGGRRLFRADRQVPPGPQSTSVDAVPVHRRLHHRPRSRPRDQRGSPAVAGEVGRSRCPWLVVRCAYVLRFTFYVSSTPIAASRV